MYTVEEAQQVMLGHFAPLDVETVGLEAALGRTLAAPVQADVDLPPFDNSSMDGFAVRAVDVAGSATEPVLLHVIGTVPAGGVVSEPVTPGVAMRIMTGAPIPPGADLVVPFEDTDDRRGAGAPKSDQVRIFRASQAGAYIRRAGEDVRLGTTVAPGQTLVTPGVVGVLASVGAAQVTVYRRPKVAILATGDELVDVAQLPGPGQIRNVNGSANGAQVLAAGGEVLQLPIATDTPGAVREQLEAGRAWGADLFLSSGGVSVGDYDVIKQVLGELGSLDFWQVKMQPGRPVAFGSVFGIPWLGLPGNPVAAMITFELFGRPALLKMSGRRFWFRATIPAIVAERITHRGDRRRYLRVRLTMQHGEWLAQLTGDQNTGTLTSMLHADGLLVVPPEMPVVEAGTRLSVMPLD